MSEDRFEKEFQRWQQQLEMRRSHGDQFDEPRPMEHLGYFKSLKAAQQAAELLAKLEYSVEINKAGFFKYSLLATRVDPIDEDYFTSVKAVIVTIENFGGEYDGVGGPVVEAES